MNDLMTSDVVALEAAVRRDPLDSTPSGALYDALQDAGASPLAARRRANKVQREAAAQALLAEMSAVVSAQTAKGGRLRTAIRSAADGDAGRSKCPIVVEAGDAPPASRGETAYHTFRQKKGEGGRCEFPGAAIRKGCKVDYHPSTLEVTVGAGWVRRRIDEGL